MNRRIFIVAILGGLAGNVLAYSALGAFLPQEIFHIKPSAFIAYVCLAGLVVLWFLCGWLAGWMSGASTRRQAMGAGALTGGIAALMVNGSFGELIAGLVGTTALLNAQILPAINEADVILRVSDTANTILLYNYISIWAAIFLGVFFGALGGWLGGALSKPSRSHAFFWQGILVSLLPLFTLLSFGVLRLYFTRMKELSNGEQNLLAISFGLHFLFLIFLHFAGWRLLKATPYTSQIPSLKTALSTFFCLALAIPATLAFMTFTNHFSISFACILLIVIVVFIGATQVVKNYRKNESQEENPRKGWLRTFLSWLGNIGEPRLLGIYFLFFALLTLLGIFLVMREALLQVIWLIAGMLLILTFAILAFRAGWQARSQEAPHVSWIEYSISASTASFLSSLWMGLNISPAFALTFLSLSFMEQGASENLVITADAQGVVNSYFNNIMPSFILFWSITAVISGILAFLVGWLLRRPQNQPSA